MLSSSVCVYQLPTPVFFLTFCVLIDTWGHFKTQVPLFAKKWLALRILLLSLILQSYLFIVVSAL